MNNSLDYLLLKQLNNWMASSSFVSRQAIFLNESSFSELIIACTIVALWFWKSSPDDRSFKARYQVLLMIFALVPTYGLARIIQSLFHRLRPIVSVPLEVPKDVQSWNSMQSVFSHFWGSFPSDHEALLFIFSIIVFSINRWLGIFSFLFSIYYGVMRISVGYLWPSDVIGGALVGSFMMLLILYIKPLLINQLIYIIGLFKRYPTRFYTISFFFLADFAQSFLFLKQLFSLFHLRLFH